MVDAGGSTVLVTGANRGIGLEACRQLKAAGFSVILTARDADEGRAAADSLGVAFSPLDVTAAEDIAALADDLSRQGRRLHGLINNAGISLEGFDGRVVRQTLAVNFFGALGLTEALLPLIGDGGAIAMVSSGMGELSAYAPALGARFSDPGLTRDQLVTLVNEFIAGVDAGTYKQAGWPGSAYRVSKAALIALDQAHGARPRAPRHPRQRGLSRLGALADGWQSGAAQRRKGRGVGHLGDDTRPIHRRLLPRRQACQLVGFGGSALGPSAASALNRLASPGGRFRPLGRARREAHAFAATDLAGRPCSRLDSLCDCRRRGGHGAGLAGRARWPRPGLRRQCRGHRRCSPAPAC